MCSTRSMFRAGIKGSSLPLSIHDVLINTIGINCGGGVCSLARVVLLCLVIDKHKRDKDDCGTNPVDEAGILLVLEDLAEE